MQGKTINGYTLQRLLGTGGMAEVWYAENKIGKKAAVKLLLPKLCQDENVKSRFLTEAEVMVKLEHPNIRQVYDYGDIDGRPAIVMEYLDGDDLKTRMKRGQRFTEAELEHWWNQLIDALDYTHQKGIVHRDLKPGNIFVDRESNIKLLDFGIAKVRENFSSTQTGQKLGTLMYMSPEQVKDSKHIDYHTDIYSLAVTFVHLLTGKKPYDSDTSSDFEISEQIVYKPLDLRGLPISWQGFLTPYLNKEPEQRPALRYFDGGYSVVETDDDEGTVVENVRQPVATPSKPEDQKTKPVDDQGNAESDSSQNKNRKGLAKVLSAVAISSMALWLIEYLSILSGHFFIIVPIMWLLFLSVAAALLTMFFIKPERIKALPIIVLAVEVLLFVLNYSDLISYLSFQFLAIAIPNITLIVLIVLKQKKEKQSAARQTRQSTQSSTRWA